MKRSAIDCLRRGALSTRANWALIPLSVAQSFAFAILLLISFVVPLLVIGGAALLGIDFTHLSSVEEWLQAFDPAAIDWSGQWVPLLLGGLSAFILSLAAVVVWAWFQGGILGVLTAAERQAHPEAERRAGAAAWFRTYSWRDFSGWGARYLWRFFWFFHLSVTVSLLILLLFVLLVLGVVAAETGMGTGAAFGLGCGGALPLGFLILLYALWYMAAQPALAREDGGLWAGAREGLRVAGRRLGAALLFLIVLLVASVIAAMASWLFQVGLQLGAGDGVAVAIALYLAVAVIQALVGAIFTIWGFGSFAALVAAERTAESG